MSAATWDTGERESELSLREVCKEQGWGMEEGSRNLGVHLPSLTVPLSS